MANENSVHSCVENNCTGATYQSLHCICKFCHQKVYVQCMREKYSFTKTILNVFGLMERNDSNYLVCKAFDQVQNEISLFNQAFNVDSPFGITCEKCSSIFKAVIEADTEAKKEPSQSTELSLSDIAFNPALTHSNEPENHQPEKSKAIYISKFKPSTSDDQVSTIIASKTALIPGSDFTVECLSGKQWTGRKLSYVSFKITPSNDTNYNLIMDENNWGSSVVASPFNPPKKPQKPASKAKHTDPKIKTAIREDHRQRNTKSKSKSEPMERKSNSVPKQKKKPEKPKYERKNEKHPEHQENSPPNHRNHHTRSHFFESAPNMPNPQELMSHLLWKFMMNAQMPMTMPMPMPHPYNQQMSFNAHPFSYSR